MRLDCPRLADEFIGRERLLCLEGAAEVAGCYEVLETGSQLNVAIMVEVLDGGVLDGAAHALDLAVGPRMFGLVSRCSLSWISQA